MATLRKGVWPSIQKILNTFFSGYPYISWICFVFQDTEESDVDIDLTLEEDQPLKKSASHTSLDEPGNMVTLLYSPLLSVNIPSAYSKVRTHKRPRDSKRNKFTC